jgi:hypothetical protein
MGEGRRWAARVRAGPGRRRAGWLRRERRRKKLDFPFIALDLSGSEEI